MNSGALFKNAKRDKDTHPNLKGDFNFVCPKCEHSTEFWMSGWTKNTKTGDKYISMAGKAKEARKEVPDATPEDDIPF